MEALYLQHLVSSQLIPSDVELPYGSIWRKSNNCLKRTIIVSIYVVVVYSVMSYKPPCPGINSIEKNSKKITRKKTHSNEKNRGAKIRKRIKADNKAIEHHLKREKKREKKDISNQNIIKKNIRKKRVTKVKFRENRKKLALRAKESLKNKTNQKRKARKDASYH